MYVFCFPTYTNLTLQDALVVDFDALRHAVMARFDICLAALRQREANGEGAKFAEIMQRDPLRYDCRLSVEGSGCELWASVARAGPWVPLAERLLGGDCRVAGCGVVTSLPGCGEQYWHSDGGHLAGAVTGWEGLHDPAAAAAPPYAICVFVPLVDLTAMNGYTEFW